MQKVLPRLCQSPHSDIKVLIVFLTITHANVSLIAPPADIPFDLVSLWIPFILSTCFPGDLVLLDSSEIRIISEL